MRKAYHYFNLLNLDVAIGAVISSAALAVLLQVAISGFVLLELGLAVWCIYTFDRLMDVRTSEQSAQSARHAFHKAYFNSLGWLLVLFIVIALVTLFYIPPQTVLWGAFLSGCVLAYFITIHIIKVEWLIHKELVIAFVYSCGIFLGPASIYSGQFTIYHVFLWSIFFLLASINLLVFSLYDYDFDVKASFPSIVRAFGEKRIKLTVDVLLALTFLLVVGVSLVLGITVLLVFLGMVVPLFLIHRCPHITFLRKNYRVIGDAVFVLPVFMLL